jgi:hypothetical protein
VIDPRLGAQVESMPEARRFDGRCFSPHR